MLTKERQETDSKVLIRIKEGNCPICGEKLENNVVLVEDARYGKVKVCNTHKVAVCAIRENKPEAANVK